MSLTDAKCRAAKHKEKPYKLADGNGLYLEIMSSGTKCWRLKYRSSKKEKRISFGIYPGVSLIEARKLTDVAKQQLQEGFDPLLIRRENKQTASLNNAQTLTLVTLEWYQTQVDTWDARYAQTVMHRFEKYVFPELGDYSISQLKPVIILACLRKIDKTAPEMARRIKQLISQVFKYAIATGRIEYDFTHGLELALKKYKKGHFASISVDDLPEFLKVMHDHKSRLYRQTYLAINLMLLTFVRTGELIQAKWSEIDFNKSLWTIPPERMKKRKTHLVPLSKQALKILYELKGMNGHREHIFPSIPRPRKPMSDGTILVAIKRMGYNKRMTGHGFRSLALGILKEKLEYPHHIADRQLAHMPKSGTDRAYDRAEFLPQRTKMMQEYADYLNEVLINSITKQDIKPD